MPHLIHSDQVGFIPMRQALDGTCCFVDLIHWAEHHQKPPLLISLEAEKAFDRVHWGYLEAVLRKFGIEDTFLQAILGLYSTPSAKV